MAMGCVQGRMSQFIGHWDLAARLLWGIQKIPWSVIGWYASPSPVERYPLPWVSSVDSTRPFCHLDKVWFRPVSVSVRFGHRRRSRRSLLALRPTRCPVFQSPSRTSPSSMLRTTVLYRTVLRLVSPTPTPCSRPPLSAVTVFGSSFIVDAFSFHVHRQTDSPVVSWIFTRYCHSRI